MSVKQRLYLRVKWSYFVNFKYAKLIFKIFLINSLVCIAGYRRYSILKYLILFTRFLLKNRIVYVIFSFYFHYFILTFYDSEYVVFLFFSIFILFYIRRMFKYKLHFIKFWEINIPIEVAKQRNGWWNILFVSIKIIYIISKTRIILFRL